MTDQPKISPPTSPAQTHNPGPATHAEQVARKTDHLDDQERRSIAEQASREEDA